jgi:hypothetical protein
MSDQAQLNDLREQAQMAYEFAKFGFAGTLYGAFGGMVLLLAFAMLQAFTDFKLETYGYVGIAVAIALCVVAYGFLSHRTMPEITVKSGDKSVTISSQGQPGIFGKPVASRELLHPAGGTSMADPTPREEAAKEPAEDPNKIEATEALGTTSKVPAEEIKKRVNLP